MCFWERPEELVGAASAATITNAKTTNLPITLECLELVDLPDVGKHWLKTGKTEEVSFTYNGGMWRPSTLKQCTGNL